jgi:bifunctional ADP-heptose synthase (sugar kinase/adenylyltransferase)
MWIHCPVGENANATHHSHIQSRPSNVIDVSGAGDTVIATASLMLAAGATPLQIAEVANIAAGQVCEHSGVVTVDLEKLIAEI